jgi:hypothetical protein
MKIDKITFYEYLKVNRLRGYLIMTAVTWFFIGVGDRMDATPIDTLVAFFVWFAVSLVYFIGMFINYKKL